MSGNDSNNAREKFLDQDIALERIDVLVARARALWLTMLGVLAFLTLTLFSVRDVDFFSVASTTQLPIVNIAIPTTAFFAAAAGLAATLHVYFHLFLLKLWDALAEAPPSVDGQPLGDRIRPWLVSDFALRLRPDRPFTRRPMDWLSTIVIFAIVWLATPTVLAGFWWRSLPAHIAWLSLMIAAALAIGIFASLQSGRHALSRLRYPGLRQDSRARDLHSLLQPSLRDLSRWAINATAILVAASLAFASLILAGTQNLPAPIEETLALAWPEEERREWLVPAQLTEAQITPRPGDWRDHDVAKRQFRVVWCREQGLPPLACAQSDEPEDGAARARWCEANGIENCPARFARLNETFESDWRTERRAYLATLQGPDLRGRDLRGASAANSFLPASDLSWARLEGATLIGAQLDGASLGGTRLDRANLIYARLDGANLIYARLDGANLINARLDGANLIGARLDRAFLGGTRLKGADLTGAQLDGASLTSAGLEGADLGNARLKGTYLRAAQLNGSDLREANLQSARWASAHFAPSLAQRADFRFARDLTQAQLEGVIGDHETRLPTDNFGNRLFVWSCWREEEAARFAELQRDRWPSVDEDIREQGFICPPGEEPQPVVPSPEALAAD